MPKAEADIRASLDAVIDDVEKNQRVYGWFAGNVGDVARATRNLVDTVSHRFDQVDQRFDQVDRRFEQVDQRFDQLESRLNTFQSTTEKHFGILTDGINKLDARMERLVPYIIRDELKGERPDAS